MLENLHIRVAFIIISVLIISSIAIPAQSGQRDVSINTDRVFADGTDNQSVRRLLLSLTPPVARYSSIDGVFYDLIPIEMEIALNKRCGLRIDPSLILHESDLESFQVVVVLPIYSIARDELRPYRGLYIGPLIGGAVDLPVTHSAGAIGFATGYSWAMKNGLQFSIGYWQAVKNPNFEPRPAGLTLALGYWFF